MNKLWFFPLVIVACVFVVWIASLYIPRAPQCGLSDAEVWAHRGVHMNAPENSLSAVEFAVSQDFRGVELDVFFDREYGLVVSHDDPYIKVNGKIVLLSDIVGIYGDTISYWIDLKNLCRQNRSEVKNAFLDLTRNNSLRERIFIESGKGRQLKYLSKDLNCIYWVQYSRKFPKRFLKLAYIRTLLLRSDFVGITTDTRYIDRSFEKNFRNLCWYVFTVNSPEVIRKLSQRPEIRVILTDLEGPYVFSTVE